MHPSFKEKLRPLQIEGVHFLQNNWAILADDMGLGKTVQAIAAAYESGGRVLAVVPSYLKLNWEKEYNMWWPGPKDMAIDADAHFSIISYAKLAKHPELFENRNTVIFDEAQYLKNFNTMRSRNSARRSKEAHKLIRITKPRNMHLLTGTPITNHIEDFYSLIKLLSYSPYESIGKPLTGDWIKNKYNFCYAFSNPKTKFFNGRKIVEFHGSRNEELLISYLKGRYKRRMKTEVVGMPSKQRSFIPLAKHWVGDKSVGDAAELIDEPSDNHMTFRNQLALVKVPFTLKFALDIFSQKNTPLIVLTEFLQPHAALIEGFKKAKLRVAIISGSLAGKERQAIVDDYQAGKFDVLVATIKSVRYGLTLTKSSTEIFNDYSYSPTDNLQVEDRILRIGQTVDCDIYYLTYGQKDKDVCDRLLVKSTVIKNVVTRLSASDLL